MSEDPVTTRLKSIKRVADQTCSAHAELRDRYANLAFALDLLILSASAWTLTLAFADPAIAARLAPFRIPPTIWTGLMGVAIFLATLTQLKLDLKGRSDAHRRACDAQADVKKAAADAARREEDPDRLTEVEARLALASAIGVPVPEREFVRLKRKHLQKVALSRHLDAHPFASPTRLRWTWWWRDNFGVLFNAETRVPKGSNLSETPGAVEAAPGSVEHGAHSPSSRTGDLVR